MPFNNKIFQVDWRRYVRQETPVELRKKPALPFVYALFSAFADLYSRFYGFRTNVQYRLSINYQVCRLEKVLNDLYDVDQRRIYIDNQPPKFLPLVLYQKLEQRPVKIYQPSEGIPLKLFVKEETPAYFVNFIIYVPADVVFIMDELVGLVRGYCLVTKTFKVQII